MSTRICDERFDEDCETIARLDVTEAVGIAKLANKLNFPHQQESICKLPLRPPMTPGAR
jgi:hypothetical protein